ncbi:MAG: ABC transporter permease [Candidatus Methanoperedens sp.]|nr:ABC transporter permease [Candidatus Methanoperedens sp.]CAG1009788.1 Lipoprotein-releasing system transmembrane protein LolE [Methanosarcinales archaeon]
MNIDDIRSALFYSKKDIFKNKKIFLFITVAIMFATANIIIINGFMDGMIKDLADNTVESSLGHLNIYPDPDERFIDGLGIKEEALNSLKEVEAYSPRVSASGVLSFKELSASATILALDPDKERRVTTLLDKLDRGTAINSNDGNAIMVSYRLAEDLKLDTGDEVTLTFENGNTKEYKIKGIIRTGIQEFDSSTVVITLIEARRQLYIENRASAVLVRLSNKEIAEDYKSILMQNLSIENVKTWKEELEYLMSFTEAYKSFSNIISVVGLLVASISVGIIVYVNVIHKKRQIGIMKAIGAKDSFIFTVFIMEALLFGLIGVPAGDILGYLAIKHMEANPFYDAIMMTWISARFGYYLLYNATAVSFAATLLAGIYPAIKASRIDIIKAIWGG